MKNINISIILIFSVFFCNCKKSFLDAKPSTEIVAPSSLSDLQGLLENTSILNTCSPALPIMASDDYIFVDYTSWLTTTTKTERNSYIWTKDLFNGENARPDWNLGYKGIFYCNSILETLPKIQVKADKQAQYNLIKGWASFLRAYILYDLVQCFANTYDTNTASTDLGLPIRLKAGVDEIVDRSSLQTTYDQILSDLTEAENLLGPTLSVNSNRPSKASVYALFARIYLSMRNYPMAEKYADLELTINSKLIDYNILSKTATAPFTTNNDETVFYSNAVTGAYNTILPHSINTAITVNPELTGLYRPKDLRLSIFFGTNASTGRLYFKRRNTADLRTFSGLATNEIYLIKAECLARRNLITDSMDWLNLLLKKRFAPVDYTAASATSQTDALTKVLQERRKELLFSGMRWSDLKRLNKEGASITLVRTLNGTTYTLPPNDPRYVFPIPDDEISASGIQQNNR